MPITEEYKSKLWYETPEPVCRPGYTGYLPQYGPKRLFQFGKTFGVMTHDLMKVHPMAGFRLGNILESRQVQLKSLEDDALVYKHEITSENNRYRSHMVSGYTGYVPRKKFLHGKAYDEECKHAVALMEKLKLID